MGQFSFKEVQQLKSVVQFLNADGTAAKTLRSSNTPDVYVDKVLIVNNDTIAHVVDFALSSGGTNYGIGSVSVPAGQGFAGTPAIDAMISLFPSGDQGLPIDNTASLVASMEVAVNSPHAVQIVCVMGWI